jgi:hypothetical protein
MGIAKHIDWKLIWNEYYKGDWNESLDLSRETSTSSAPPERKQQSQPRFESTIPEKQTPLSSQPPQQWNKEPSQDVSDYYTRSVNTPITQRVPPTTPPTRDRNTEKPYEPKKPVDEFEEFNQPPPKQNQIDLSQAFGLDEIEQDPEQDIMNSFLSSQEHLENSQLEQFEREHAHEREHAKQPTVSQQQPQQQYSQQSIYDERTSQQQYRQQSQQPTYDAPQQSHSQHSQQPQQPSQPQQPYTQTQPQSHLQYSQHPQITYGAPQQQYQKQPPQTQPTYVTPQQSHLQYSQQQQQYQQQPSQPQHTYDAPQQSQPQYSQQPPQSQQLRPQNPPQSHSQYSQQYQQQPPQHTYGAPQQSYHQQPQPKKPEPERTIKQNIATADRAAQTDQINRSIIQKKEEIRVTQAPREQERTPKSFELKKKETSNRRESTGLFEEEIEETVSESQTLKSSNGLFEDEIEQVHQKKPVRAAPPPPVTTKTNSDVQVMSVTQQMNYNHARLQQQKTKEEKQTPPANHRRSLPVYSGTNVRLGEDELLASPRTLDSPIREQVSSPRNRKSLSVHFDDAVTAHSVDTDGTDHDIDSDLEDEGIQNFLNSYASGSKKAETTLSPRSPVIEPRSPVTATKSPVEPRSPVVASKSPIFEPRSPLTIFTKSPVSAPRTPEQDNDISYTSRASRDKPLFADLSPHAKLKTVTSRTLPQFFSLDSETSAIYINQIMNTDVNEEESETAVPVQDVSQARSEWRLSSERARQFKARTFVSKETVDLILYGVKPRHIEREPLTDETDTEDLTTDDKSEKKKVNNPIMLRLQIPPTPAPDSDEELRKRFSRMETMSVPTFGKRPVSFSPTTTSPTNLRMHTAGTPMSFMGPKGGSFYLPSGDTSGSKSPKLKSVNALYDSGHNTVISDPNQEGGVRPTIKIMLSDDFYQCMKTSPMLAKWLKNEPAVLEVISLGENILKNTKRGRCHPKFIFVDVKQGTLVWCSNAKARNSADSRPTAKRSLDLRRVNTIKMLEIVPREAVNLGVKLNEYNRTKMFYGIVFSGERHVEVIMEKDFFDICQWVVGVGLVVHNLRRQNEIRRQTSVSLLPLV